MTATTSVPHKVLIDGATYEFSERQKVQKKSVILEGGSVLTRFIFRNGEVREHVTAPDAPLYARAAMHGLDQKFGDEFAGEQDVEDCVEAFEELSARLSEGEWRERKAEGISGTSMLLRALIEHTGKEKEVLKASLKLKTPAQKKALSVQKDIARIIARLKEERAAGEKVDEKAAEAELASMFT
jgi:hypothetical protein